MANVAETLLDILAEAGVRTLYGIPGDAINTLIDAIRRQDTIRFVQVRHEESGAFAAAAHAKLTGELGVCVGTAGPGAIHLLNGLYDAKMDHAPVLAITGQVETSLVGTDYHQEVDLATLFKDVAAFNQVVMTPEQMPHVAVHAVQAALSGRTVAHLSLPVDVASAKVPDPDRRHVPFTGNARSIPCEEELDRAAAILNDADTVAILAGIGCRGARAELMRVAERLRAPIVKTLRAKDLFPDDHPQAAGYLGLLGTRPGVDAVEGCDALLLAGTDFPYHAFYPEGVPAVQIDIEATRLGRRYPVDVGLAGHAAPTLAALESRLEQKMDGSLIESVREGVADWNEKMARKETSEDVPLHPQAVARAVGEAAADDAIFVADTGAVTVWSSRNLKLRGEQRFTLSSALASMAFALPGAIGAQIAYPGRQVIALAGDGGFSMLMPDFATAVKYELPITVVVFNNHKLGLIQMEQEVQGFPEFQTHLHDIDFTAVARACGGEGARVRTLADLRSSLAEALASPRPWVLDVEVNPEERTMPPRIELEQAVGFGVAKVKEFLGKGDKDGGPSVLKG